MATAESLLFNRSSNGTSMKDTTFCGLVPSRFLEVKFYLISIVGSIITVFGLFGNLSTALILTRPSMRSPNNLYLTALAIFDSCLLITAFLIYSMEHIIEYAESLDMYVVWLTYLRLMFGLSHISQTGSVYITVTVTLERLLAVVSPKHGRRYCTKYGASLSIMAVTTFAVLFNCTKFFEVAVRKNYACPEHNFQSYILVPSNLSSHPLYMNVFTLWTTNVVMMFVPFVTLATVNSVIAYQMRRTLRRLRWAGTRLSQHSELKTKSREDTIVLIFIVFIFLGCNVWGFLLTLAESVLGSANLATNYPTEYTFTREAINFLTIINSSVNFVIYCIFGKDFRRELVVVYGCGIRSMTVMLPATQDKFAVWRRRSRGRRRHDDNRADGRQQHHGDETQSDYGASSAALSDRSPQTAGGCLDNDVALKHFHRALAVRFGSSASLKSNVEAEDNVSKNSRRRSAQEKPSSPIVEAAGPSQLRLTTAVQLNGGVKFIKQRSRSGDGLQDNLL